jgi:hypothetical protein
VSRAVALGPGDGDCDAVVPLLEPINSQIVVPLSLSQSPTGGGHKTDTSETTRATPRDARSSREGAGLAGKTVSWVIARVRAWTPRNLHGKEGVDGSSPSEGFSKVPVNWHFLVAYLLNTRTHSGHIRGTRDVSRRLATPSDTTLKASQIASIPENPCKQAAAVV